MFSAKVVVPLVLASIGGLIFIYAAFSYYKQSRFVSKAINATGEVIDYNRSRSSETNTRTGEKNVTSTVPVIQFTTLSGDVVSFVSKSNDNIEDYSAVPILYLAESPENAQINLFFSVWGWIYVLGGFGVMLILISLALRVMI